MGALEGRYGCMRGPIIGFESRAILARVTKQIVTIVSITCDKKSYIFTPPECTYNFFGLPLIFPLTYCSALQKPITFLFVNENIKCGYAFS